MSGSQGAVFLDRDNTIVVDPGYLHEPAKAVLMPGAAAGMAEMNRNGWPLVVISNQSGMARGMYGPTEWDAVNRRIAELLGAQGARVLAWYFCPHHPDFTGPCPCRKPGTKLFKDAATEHGIALERSWLVGDRLSDVQPAKGLGAKALLLNSDAASEDSRAAAALGVTTVPSLVEAARLIGRRG